MSLLQLAEHAVFDDTDEAGVILDTRQSVYLSLNVTATCILQVALRHDTADEVIARLRDRFAATDETLRAGLDSLTAELGRRALLATATRRESR
ncbi:PqqD family protein [Amycolatopsis sp. lyj-346]|uniref:PqqD family protein n=1 Tax=Amycolatopsis sp. lyj-346 TaxID=2789289 RepID=UPI00397AC582